jgi:hypothetical protein
MVAKLVDIVNGAHRRTNGVKVPPPASQTSGVSPRGWQREQPTGQDQSRYGPLLSQRLSLRGEDSVTKDM